MLCQPRAASPSFPTKYIPRSPSKVPYPCAFCKGGYLETLSGGTAKLDALSSWSPPFENHEGWGTLTWNCPKSGPGCLFILKRRVARPLFNLCPRHLTEGAPPLRLLQGWVSRTCPVAPRSMMLQARGSHPSKTTKGGAPSLGICLKVGASRRSGRAFAR